MGHPLRMYEASDCWFITARCFQARMLMTPHSPLVREVCGGVLAQAAQKHGVALHAYAFMSNHLHLVVRARGRVVAAFLQYLMGNLARKLAPLCSTPWWGRFWERRASVAPILDPQALEAMVRYVLAHGVKEGLVARAQDWAGLHCATQMLAEQPLRFPWYDWTKRWNARNRDGFERGTVAGKYDTEWALSLELKLAPMPHWEPHAPEVRRQLVAAMLAEHERERAGRPVLGADAVKQESAEPRRPRKRTPRPWCHASTPEGHRDYCRAYRDFLGEFRAAAMLWLKGDVQANFPPGCFRPHVWSFNIQIV